MGLKHMPEACTRESNAELDGEIRGVDVEIWREERLMSDFEHEGEEALAVADKFVEIYDGEDYLRTKEMLRSVFQSMLLDQGQLILTVNMPFELISAALLMKSLVITSTHE